MSLIDLLRFAEDVSSFIDPEKIRVCLPPFEGATDCVLILDGVNEVPSPSLWFSIDRETGANELLIEAEKSNDDSQPSTIVKKSSAVSTPFHTRDEVEVMNRELNPSLPCSSPDSPESVPFAPKELFSPARCELSSTSEEVKELLPKPELDEPVVNTTTETAPDAEGAKILGREVPIVQTDNLEEPGCAETVSGAQRIMTGFDAFMRVYKDRAESLHSESPHHTHKVAPNLTAVSGEVMYYHVTQTFRVEGNLALCAAMKLSVELDLPLVALVMLDNETVADATTPQPVSAPHYPATNSNVVEDTPRCSVGDKRKLHDATAGIVLEEEFDYRTVTLNGLHRKNCTKVDTILRLKEDLAALNVPLVVVEYDAAAPRTPHTASPLYESSSGGGGAVPAAVAVTPQPTVADEIHPISYILIAACSTAGIATATPSATSATSTAQLHTVSGQKHESSSPSADARSLSACRAAALFTDDLLHPMDRYVYRAVADAMPALPIYCVDSISQGVVLKQGSARVGVCDTSGVMSFEEFCEYVKQQRIFEEDQARGRPCGNSVQSLSTRLLRQKDNVEHAIEECLVSSPHGAVCPLQRHRLDPQYNPRAAVSMTTSSTEELTQCHMLFVQYGRYLCGARAGNLAVLTPRSAGAGGSWSVPWLNMLSPDAARCVKKIDAALRKVSAKSGETEHSRRQRLHWMRRGKTKSEVYNDITRELYERGGTMCHDKLVYWIVYCVSELCSVMQAIQYTFTVLATHSNDNFACSVGQVSLFIHALDEVCRELGDNIPMYSGSMHNFDNYVTALLAKHNVNV